MARGESFEDFLYKSGAVYVDALSAGAPHLSLLDVLVKDGSESSGWFWFSENHPILVRCGSMEEVGTYSDPAEQRKLHTNGLDRFDHCTKTNTGSTYDERVFKWIKSSAGRIEKKFTSSESLKHKLLAAGYLEAGIHFSNTENLEISIEKMETASVNKNMIAKLVKEQLWKPTVSELWPSRQNSCLPDIRTNKLFLWVVHEILYASKLTVISKASTSIKAQVTCHVGPGIEGGPQIIRSAKHANTINLSDPGIDSKYPGKIMFAFRALRFHFNDAGEYRDMEADAGPVRPISRGSDDDESDHDEERLQIRDLFVVSPTSDDESDEETCLDLRALPIRDRPSITKSQDLANTA